MKTHKTSAPRPTRQRGLAAVEMVIVLPVMLLLMLATAEVGRAFFQYNTLTKAVRDGARYTAANAGAAVSDVNLTGEVIAAVQNLVVYGFITSADGNGDARDALLPGLVPGDISVTQVGTTSDALVSATYAYQPMLGGALPTFGLGAAINTSFVFNASVVVRAL